MKEHYRNKYEEELDQITLKYGTILTDDKFMLEVLNSYGDGFDRQSVRIRIIEYEGHIYYHKMIHGEVVEFKELI